MFLNGRGITNTTTDPFVRYAVPGPVCIANPVGRMMRAVTNTLFVLNAGDMKKNSTHTVTVAQKWTEVFIVDNNVYAEALEQLCDAFAQFVEALKEVCRKIAEAIVNAFQWLVDCGITVDMWYIEQYEEKNLGSMRVPYLALYTKKRRVRKKNMNRLKKMVDDSL